MWLLGTDPRSTGRGASTFNLQAISPAPLHFSCTNPQHWCTGGGCKPASPQNLVRYEASLLRALRILAAAPPSLHLHFCPAHPATVPGESSFCPGPPTCPGSAVPAGSHLHGLCTVSEGGSGEGTLGLWERVLRSLLTQEALL